MQNLLDAEDKLVGLYNEGKNLEIDGENPEEETPETELEVDFRKYAMRL